MKSIPSYLSLLLLLPFFVLMSCGGKKEENPRQVIAGETSKTWVARKETNAQGDKEKLSSAEKDQRMVFYANGTFQIKDNAEFQSGRWNYNPTQKEIEIVFDDREGVKEIFHVQTLENDKMVLHASDGSEMQLKPE